MKIQVVFMALATSLVSLAFPAPAATELIGAIAQVSGSAHSCALFAGNVIKCWGDNSAGQLGDGTTTDRLAPVPMLGVPAGVTAIAAGGTSTCVLAAGTVKCYGSIPQFVLPAGTTVAAVSVGGSHACILTSAGGVKCWGDNGQGKLGDGTTTASPAPVDVVGLASGVTAVSAGGSHTCAVTTLKRVKCWGGNTVFALTGGPTVMGQLGDGSSVDHSTPVDVVNLVEDIASVHAGQWDTCAVTVTGTVKCWGMFTNTPADQAGLANILATAGGGGSRHPTLCCVSYHVHRCALATSGEVKCWGSDLFGQRGDGFLLSSSTPTPMGVIGLASGATSISVGSGHACALMADGRVRCWGQQSEGQLGDGKATPDAAPIVDVGGLGNTAVAIDAGSSHTCARTSTGGAKCWGANELYTLVYTGPTAAVGDGSFVNRLSAVDVSGLASGVGSISAGPVHTCAVTQAGAAYCWGSNGAGQVGDGTTLQRGTPVAVSGLSANVAGIAAGSLHTCARMSDGSAKCWGFNNSGQLGNNSHTSSSVPVDVQGVAGVVEIVAGDGHTCARSAGQVWCWGANGGLLGDGTSSTTPRLTPAPVPGLGLNIAAIVAGGFHSCVLLTTGTVKCWGTNATGQLGDNTTQPRASPTDVVGLTGVVALDAGWHHTCAVTVAGGVKCWGENDSGQLGDGTRVNSSKPIDVPGFTSGVAAIATGMSHSCALMTTGAVRCWGGNIGGQLGNGFSAMDGARPYPAPVVAGFDMTVARLGTGTGTVTSGGAEITCGGTCAATFAFNTPVTLTVSAAAGSVFTGWSGAGCSGTGTCQVAMTQAANVSATFALDSPIARAGNISTRANVGTGQNVMIAGFIIGGSTSKTVVVNVAGPSLAAAGVTNPIADPVLTLIRSSDGTTVATNDDWQNQDPTIVAAIRQRALQANNGREPALIATLAPGAYTAIVDGFAGGSGAGLIGVFEVDHPETPLINISTRGQVLTGNDVMIAGFIIQGSGSQKVVVNVAGPSLAGSGITSPLANPTLAIVRASDGAIVAANDDWQSQANPADVAAIQATGLQPNHPQEPALLLDLAPGAYTAVVQGAGGTSGVGLVGVFAVP